MDTGIVVALVGAAGLVGAGGTGTVVAHILGRRLRAAQVRQAEAQAKAQEAQAEQLKADADRIRQDIYQQLTQDLRAELEKVKTALSDAQTSLAHTSAEAERLRRRVVELESRVAQLEQTEQHLSAELRAAQAERDQLRIALAGREATITALTAQIGDLKTQLAAGAHP